MRRISQEGESGPYHKLWEWLLMAHGVDLNIDQLQKVCRVAEESCKDMEAAHLRAWRKESRNQ